MSLSQRPKRSTTMGPSSPHTLQPPLPPFSTPSKTFPPAGPSRTHILAITMLFRPIPWGNPFALAWWGRRKKWSVRRDAIIIADDCSRTRVFVRVRVCVCACGYCEWPWRGAVNPFGCVEVKNLINILQILFKISYSDSLKMVVSSLKLIAILVGISWDSVWGWFS